MKLVHARFMRPTGAIEERLGLAYQPEVFVIPRK